MDKSVRAFRTHCAVAVIYGLVGLLGFALLASRSLSSGLVILLVLAIPATLHGCLAVGARRRLEWSRKISLVLGCVMLLGFPIGTLIGISLILACNSPWEPEVPKSKPAPRASTEAHTVG